MTITPTVKHCVPGASVLRSPERLIDFRASEWNAIVEIRCAKQLMNRWRVDE